eukprot:ANDGO_08267.mRNA.1 hypothetical protein
MPLADAITFDQLEVFFHLPLKVAAQRLGVSESSLRSICRKHRIVRWPYRKIQRLESNIRNMERALMEGREEGYSAQLMETLRAGRAILILEPNCSVEEAVQRAVSSRKKPSNDNLNAAGAPPGSSSNSNGSGNSNSNSSSSSSSSSTASNGNSGYVHHSSTGSLSSASSTSTTISVFQPSSSQQQAPQTKVGPVRLVGSSAGGSSNGSLNPPPPLPSGAGSSNSLLTMPLASPGSPPRSLIVPRNGSTSSAVSSSTSLSNDQDSMNYSGLQQQQQQQQQQQMQMQMQMQQFQHHQQQQQQQQQAQQMAEFNKTSGNMQYGGMQAGLHSGLPNAFFPGGPNMHSGMPANNMQVAMQQQAGGQYANYASSAPYMPGMPSQPGQQAQAQFAPSSYLPYPSGPYGGQSGNPSQQQSQQSQPGQQPPMMNAQSTAGVGRSIPSGYMGAPLPYRRENPEDFGTSFPLQTPMQPPRNAGVPPASMRPAAYSEMMHPYNSPFSAVPMQMSNQPQMRNPAISAVGQRMYHS